MCSFCALHAKLPIRYTLIRQVAALWHVKNWNIDYILVFAYYLWLCSRWNFCNRSTLRENISQSTMCYFFETRCMFVCRMHHWRWPSRFGWQFEAKWTTQSPVSLTDRPQPRQYVDCRGPRRSRCDRRLRGPLAENVHPNREGHGQSCIGLTNAARIGIGIGTGQKVRGPFTFLERGPSVVCAPSLFGRFKFYILTEHVINIAKWSVKSTWRFV